MLVLSKIREILLDTLSMKLDIEEIKRRLSNQDKNLELVFSYLDELIEKKVTSRMAAQRVKDAKASLLEKV